MEFRNDPQTLRLWREAGADVRGERVRFEPGHLRQILASAPRSFVQHARNPQRSVQMGGNAVVFAPGYGMPFVQSLDEPRRYGTLDDLVNLIKLAYVAPAMHHSGGVLCEPTDVPVSQRHLEVAYAHLRWSDKPFIGVGTSGVRAEDTIAMAQLAFGADFVDRNCCLTSIININSPLVLDATMLEALRAYASANQASIVTPFVMGGAMGPVSVAGMVTQVLAEGLAGAALTQLVRPGSPVIFGVMLSGLNMKTGAPTRGAESWLAMLVLGQLVRRLGIPFRGGAASSTAKVLDSQAGQESADMLLMTVLSGVNFLIHAAGHLEGGLCTSYEKFMQDCDHLNMVSRFLEGVDFAEDEFALRAFHEIGPGQHYLSAAHTMERYADAFYISDILDSESYEQWHERGELTAAQRANAAWKRALAAYEAPPIDPGLDEGLRDFVERKKTELAGQSE
jgi:trimethylamine--corrinoid protein Co-methyltransferase